MAVDWPKVAIAFVLLFTVFTLALWLDANGHQGASDSLFRSFELLFAATIGLLGLEDVKHG